MRRTTLSAHFIEVNREKKKTNINTKAMLSIRVVLLVTIAVVMDALSANYPDCKKGPLSTFPICDQSIPTHQRAADLVSRMTTAEKITQMVHLAAAIPRLGLPSYDWWSEALHGVYTYSGAISFPQVINLGGTFNMSLVYHVASVISTEAFALNNEGGTTFCEFMIYDDFRDSK